MPSFRINFDIEPLCVWHLPLTGFRDDDVIVQQGRQRAQLQVGEGAGRPDGL